MAALARLPARRVLTPLSPAVSLPRDTAGIFFSLPSTFGLEWPQLSHFPMPEQGYNPFAKPLEKKPAPLPPLTENARRIAEYIDEELTKPDPEEQTARLASAAALEKTKRIPAVEAARKMEEEEVVEGELVEDGAPDLEGFQEHGTVMQEQQMRAQRETTDPQRVGLEGIDPRNPASLKEGVKRVVDSFLGTEEHQRDLEAQLGLGTGKLALERRRLETLLKDKVAGAAFALRGKIKPAFQIIDELRQDIANIVRKL